MNERVTGRLSRHRDGYGFVIPDKPLPRVVGDVFIPAHAILDAMHGDRVEIRLGNIDARGRAEGRVQKILRRAHAEVVGRFRRGKNYSFVIPEDQRVGDEILIPRGAEIPSEDTARQRTGDLPKKAADLDGAIVNIEITRFPSATQKARGRVIEILGRPGDFGIDVEIIIRKHHLPHRFPPEVLAEAAVAPQAVSEDVAAGRRDFRDLPIITIDGETARDFDDAVYVERFPNGNYALQVHVADVSHYVRPGTELDREARRCTFRIARCRCCPSSFPRASAR
jgi:ribonuclease R